MSETKPWYLSRTIWAAIVSVVATMAGALGYPVDEIGREGLVEALLQIVAAAAGILAILGRFTATTRIG